MKNDQIGNADQNPGQLSESLKRSVDLAHFPKSGSLTKNDDHVHGQGIKEVGILIGHVQVLHQSDDSQAGSTNQIQIRIVIEVEEMADDLRAEVNLLPVDHLQHPRILGGNGVDKGHKNVIKIMLQAAAAVNGKAADEAEVQAKIEVIVEEKVDQSHQQEQAHLHNEFKGKPFVRTVEQLFRSFIKVFIF